MKLRPIHLPLLAITGILLSAVVAQAWTGPSATAPGNNVAAPINVGVTTQTKAGLMGVNSLAVFGDTLLAANSYINWGLTAGSGGYGIRDNAGILEFKQSSAGSWQTMQAFVAGLVGTSPWVTNGTHIYNSNTGNVGVGTAAPGSKLTVSANTSNLPASIGGAGTVAQFGAANAVSTRIELDSFAAVPSYDLKRANGTAAAPTALLANETIGQLTWFGYGATAFSGGARSAIRAYAAENWTDLAQGSYMALWTTPVGGATLTERVRIDAAGNIGIGTTAPNDKLQIATPAAGNLALRWYQTGVAEWWAGMQSGSGNWQLGAGSGHTPLMTVSTGGYVGVGTTVPTAKLHVGGTSGVDGIRFPDGTLQTTASGATGQWTTSATNIYNSNAGNVGIGTGASAPTQKLDVNGYLRLRTINGEGGTILLDGNNGTGVYLENISGIFRLINSGWTAEMLTVDQSGNTKTTGNINTAGRGQDNWYNINTGSIGAWGSIYSYGPICTGNGSGACNGASGTVIGLANNAATNNIPNTGNIFFNGGNVGIGVASPVTKLDVRGTTLMRYDETNYDVWLQGGATSAGGNARNLAMLGTIPDDKLNINWYGEYAGGTSIHGTAGPALNVLANGNVGMGSASPPTRLTVGNGGDGWANGLTLHSTYPTIYLRDADHRSAMIHVNSNYLYVLRGCSSNDPASGNNWCTYNGVWPLAIDLETNNVSIGGSLYAPAFLYTSDRRLKENIRPIDNSLAKLLRLNPVTFDWNQDTGGHAKGDHDMGLIAQEVEKIIPDVVTTDPKGMKGINYPKLIPILIGAIKEQQTEIESLKSLRDEVRALKKEIEALKK
jgi:Chaperone of endosialidase